ncbi:uncharacterized protein LOC118900447 [Balaenoptera musculus]|uniref:Uncharacterized protein LOC118900447 n=1 Tax=Balaenoptera musculus TaxID=9771 RepID=A0A8B8YA00_BALMU|nr:uncharacterized protein LOC118900447 [Balaenoptera musculus]
MEAVLSERRHRFSGGPSLFSDRKCTVLGGLPSQHSLLDFLRSPWQNVVCTHSELQLYQVSSARSTVNVLLVIKKKKKKERKKMQSAIRQNIFWTAVTDIILTGERARIWCGVASVFFPARSLPLTREAWGLQMPSLAAGSQGTRGKLVNVSQVISIRMLGTPPLCHLFYCPKWLLASLPPTAWKKNAEKFAYTSCIPASEYPFYV